MKSVSIAGASGYAGAELIRIIHDHPNFELKAIAAGSNAGSTLAEVHPQFSSVKELAESRNQAISAAADKFGATLRA